MSVAPGVVKVFCFAGSMMLANEVENLAGKFGFFGASDAVRNVSDYNSCALNGVECIVGVDSVLVFGKERGVVDFADVVVQGACSNKLYIGSNAVGGSRCKVADSHGVLEGSGAFFGEFAEHGVVYVGKLNKSDFGYETENFFKQENGYIGE